ncbi:MAG: GspE/PulE/PilB domain-containing protein [Thermoanaerobaculia bacterium]
MLRQNLGHMLLAANLIDEVQMQVALAEQRTTGRRFGSTLVDLKFIDENVLAAFLSKQIDIPCISLLHIDIPKKVLRKVPARLARECQAIPIRVDETHLEVAMVDPTDIDYIQILETACGMTISPLIAPQSSIEKMIDRFYPAEVTDDTVALRMPADVEPPQDPLFRDLIDEIESGDFDERLNRIEESLNHIWVMVEKVLRKLEAQEADEPTEFRKADG